jgi:hypothetical protein
MAIGTRQKRERQQDLWIAANDVVETPANAFYHRLNQILDQHKFDAKVEPSAASSTKRVPTAGQVWRRASTFDRF